MPSNSDIEDPQKSYKLFGRLPKILLRIFDSVEAFQESPDTVDILLNINNMINIKQRVQNGLRENRRAIELIRLLQESKYHYGEDLNNFIENSINSFDWITKLESYDSTNISGLNKNIVSKRLNLVRDYHRKLFQKAHLLQNQGMQINYADCTDGTYIANPDLNVFYSELNKPKINESSGQGPRRRLLSLASQNRFEYARDKSDISINEQLILNLDCDIKVTKNWLNEKVKYKSAYDKGPTLLIQRHELVADIENILQRSFSTRGIRVHLLMGEFLKLALQIKYKEKDFPAVAPWPGTYVVNASADEVIDSWDCMASRNEDTDYYTRLRKAKVQVIIEDSVSTYQVDRIRMESFLGRRIVEKQRDGHRLKLRRSISLEESDESQFLNDIFQNSEILSSWENISAKILNDIINLPSLNHDERDTLRSVFSYLSNDEWNKDLEVILRKAKSENISIDETIGLLQKLRLILIKVQSKGIYNDNGISGYLTKILKSIIINVDKYLPWLEAVSIDQIT